MNRADNMKPNCFHLVNRCSFYTALHSMWPYAPSKLVCDHPVNTEEGEEEVRHAVVTLMTSNCCRATCVDKGDNTVLDVPQGFREEFKHNKSY